MIKILFFIPGLSEGGAEKVLRNLVNNMDQSEFDITVQTIDKYNPKAYLADGIHYKAINRCKTKVGRKLFSLCFRLCAELKIAYSLFVKDNYDIEVAYLETGATKIIAQSTNKKAVKLAWVHCDLSKKGGMSDTVDKVRAQYRRFDKIICVSEDVKNGFNKLYGSDFSTEVIYNVIDEDEILKKADSEVIELHNDEIPQLLAVGRLTLQKNFQYLIGSCAKLRDDGYSFCLNILGEGPEKENLDKLIKSLQLEDCVKLRGFLSNPYPWIKASDIIVCSSKYEGLSTVVQEAFILGKTIVTAPCTGMKELLGNSEYGLIVSSDKDGLYNGIKRMLDFPDEAENFAMAAKERSKAFAKKNVVRKTEAFFIDELNIKQ